MARNDIANAQQARAEQALDYLTRYNGSAMVMSRRSLIERLVTEGHRVTHRKNGERVLMGTDGSYLDAKNITKAGLDYAERIVAEGVGEAA